MDRKWWIVIVFGLVAALLAILSARSFTIEYNGQIYESNETNKTIETWHCHDLKYEVACANEGEYFDEERQAYMQICDYEAMTKQITLNSKDYITGNNTQICRYLGETE